MYMVLWKSSPTMGDRRREGKPAVAPTSLNFIPSLADVKIHFQP